MPKEKAQLFKEFSVWRRIDDDTLLRYRCLQVLPDGGYCVKSSHFYRYPLSLAINTTTQYRRGETPFVDDKPYFMFCRSARPVLAKYNLDADLMIRNTVAGFLSYTYSVFNMRLLAAQVETYPLKYAFALQRLSNYRCKDLLKLKAQRRAGVRNALIKEARSDPDALANGGG